MFSDSGYDEQKALRALIDRRENAGPFAATLVPDMPAQWHVLTIEPAHERVAAAHLTGRRFGIYLPEWEETKIIRGRLARRQRLLFPGYLFIFVWDISRHMRRVLACPGVQEVLAPITDGQIDVIRAEENRLNPMFTEITILIKRKKRWRQSHKPVMGKRIIQVDPDDVVAIRTKSYLHDLETLDDAARNGALRKALGLSS